jgi:hypothetical protein
MTNAGPVVQLDDQLEASAWAERLGVTHEQLAEAVEAVGNRAADVELHLKGTRATTNADAAAQEEPGAEAGDVQG